MGLIKLTEKEYDLITMLDKTNQEIADETGEPIGTINYRYYRLSAKLNVTSRTQMVIKALKYGLVELGAFSL